MGTGRIVSERRDADASIARAVQSGLVEIRPSGTIAGVEPSSYVEFETLVNGAARHSRSATPRSPRQVVAEFVEPWISDPTPFVGGRALSILERLASDIIPALAEGEELRSLAGAIIADEIARHRELAMRLQTDIAL